MLMSLMLVLAFVVLTLLTQIGGMVFLLVWLISRLFAAGWVRASKKSYLFAARGMNSWVRTAVNAVLFVAIYATLTILVVPPLAASQNRVPLPCIITGNEPLRVAHPLFCALNRHYVDARLLPLAVSLARAMDRRFPGTVTVALDAGFPFLNGFPLLPHLSHNDGRKLDLAYYYTDDRGRYLPGLLRSPVGYWAFEQPGTADKPSCEHDSWLTLRWNMTWVQPLFPDRRLDANRTREALRWIVTAGQPFGVERVFIEPYLAARLGVTSPLLGFQGCRAARHDDHIHVQIK
jgi:hypothetical protein